MRVKNQTKENIEKYKAFIGQYVFLKGYQESSMVERKVLGKVKEIRKSVKWFLDEDYIPIVFDFTIEILDKFSKEERINLDRIKENIVIEVKGETNPKNCIYLLTDEIEDLVKTVESQIAAQKTSLIKIDRINFQD